MKFINASNQTVTVAEFNIFGLAPGSTAEIPDAYAKPGRARNGARVPSTIEHLAPQLKPADEDERRAWEGVPADEPVAARPQMPSVDGMVAAGVPRGVAEKLVEAAQASKGGAGTQQRRGAGSGKGAGAPPALPAPPPAGDEKK